MTERGDVRGPRRPRRHELENQRRGARARQHLSRTRELERQRLRERERDRERARRRATSLAWRRPRRIAWALCLPISLIAGLLWGRAWVEGPAGLADGNPLRIDAIAVQGARRLGSEAVAVATGVARGSRLRDVDVPGIEARLASEPWIRASRVLRLPTGTLIVRIEEREPAALLRIEGGAQGASATALVDGSGTPFASASEIDSDSLPRLVSASPLAQGEPHPELQAALDLCRRLAERPLPAIAAGPQPLELRLPVAGSQEGWVLQSRDRSFEAVLGLDQLEARLDRLAQLLASPLPDVRAAVRIDLRFADRAVLRGASASG